MVGSTLSSGAGRTDVYLVRTDVRGDTLWTRTLGGADFDIGYSVEQTHDGGYIVAGSTRSFGAGGYDAWLVKTDARGDTQWTRTFGGPGDDGARSVAQTGDGGYVLAGCTDTSFEAQGDVYLVRTGARGNAIWTRKFGGPMHDEAFSVRQTADSGFIIAGLTQSYGAGSDDVWLIKTDAGGETQWNRTFGGDEEDFGYSVLQTADGGYVVAGLNESWGAGGEDVYLVRTDAHGDTLWTRTIGGPRTDEAHSVLQTADGGFIVAGSTSSWGAGDFDPFLVRFSTHGDTLWTRTFGGPGDDGAWSVAPGAGGGLLVGGYRSRALGSDRDMLLLVTDSRGRASAGRPKGH